MRWLRQLAARGIVLGGIDTGSYYLAKAGLLNGYRCTIHWEDRETLLEEFPQRMSRGGCSRSTGTASPARAGSVRWR